VFQFGASCYGQEASRAACNTTRRHAQISPLQYFAHQAPSGRTTGAANNSLTCSQLCTQQARAYSQRQRRGSWIVLQQENHGQTIYTIVRPTVKGGSLVSRKVLMKSHGRAKAIIRGQAVRPVPKYMALGRDPGPCLRVIGQAQFFVLAPNVGPACLSEGK